MKFPDALTVVAIDQKGAPAANVAIVLLLFATRKNDYYVGPFITDENGHVQFTREHCERAIRSAQEMFVMDYAGDLDNLRPVIEVRLHPPEHLEAMQQQYRRFPDFWGQAFQDPVGLFAALQTARNAEYELARITATEEQILTHPQLVLSLMKKAA